MDRKQLLQTIIAREAEMFVTVKTSEPADCQTMLNTFRMLRAMSHSVLADDTLASYLQDLETAAATGRNLMTEKYARMENLIPQLNENELIGKIVDIEREWLSAVHKKYPLTVAVDGGFTTYAVCELETYSDETLNLYYRDIFLAATQKRNLVEERYRYLYCNLGFKDLEEVETLARKHAAARSEQDAEK